MLRYLCYGSILFLSFYLINKYSKDNNTDNNTDSDIYKFV